MVLHEPSTVKRFEFGTENIIKTIASRAHRRIVAPGVPDVCCYGYGYEDCRGHPGAPPIRYDAYSTLSVGLRPWLAYLSRGYLVNFSFTLSRSYTQISRKIRETFDARDHFAGTHTCARVY